MNALISKARRPKFELTFKIIDLNNIPLVTGVSYVKWHIPSSTHAEHRGRTDKAPITEHHVSWDYERTISLRLTMDKSNQLQEFVINFEIIQEYGAARGDKIMLGYVNLNLSEYVEPDDDDGITRRYLMQESKINSTLKISIIMKQLDGEKNWIAPPLKTASVFGGIAGIMAGDQGQQDDSNYVSSMSKSRETGELQDMYRRTLAASWLSQAGELPADECIEDIFSGGDGWQRKGGNKHGDRLSRANERSDDDDELLVPDQGHHRRAHSGSPALRPHGFGTLDRKTSKSSSNLPAEASLHGVGSRNRMQLHQKLLHHRGKNSLDKSSVLELKEDTSSESSEQGRGRKGFKAAQELNEFQVREDLRSWRLPNTT